MRNSRERFSAFSSVDWIFWCGEENRLKGVAIVSRFRDRQKFVAENIYSQENGQQHADPTKAFVAAIARDQLG